MYAQLKYGDLFPFDHTDLNLVGFIYERLCDRLNQFLHLTYLRGSKKRSFGTFGEALALTGLGCDSFRHVI